VQVGTQRRSAANYQRAKDSIAAGEFGDIVREILGAGSEQVNDQRAIDAAAKCSAE